MLGPTNVPCVLFWYHDLYKLNFKNYESIFSYTFHKITTFTEYYTFIMKTDARQI